MIKLENLKNLLEKYFEDDKDIKILLEKNDIFIKIDEKYSYRILRIHIRNESIYIDDLSDDNERIELFRLNFILYEFDEMRMNLLIIQFLKNFIDIIE